MLFGHQRHDSPRRPGGRGTMALLALSLVLVAVVPMASQAHIIILLDDVAYNSTNTTTGSGSGSGQGMGDSETHVRHGDIFYLSAPYNLTGRAYKYNFTANCNVAPNQPFNIYPNIALIDFDEAWQNGCASYQQVLENNDLIVAAGLYIFTQASFVNSAPGFIDMMGATGFYVDKRYSVTTLYPGEQDGFVELVTSTGAAGYLIYASNFAGSFAVSTCSAEYKALQIYHYVVFGLLYAGIACSTAWTLIKHPDQRKISINTFIRVVALVFTTLRLIETVDLLGYSNVFAIFVRYSIWWVAYWLGFFMVCLLVDNWLLMIGDTLTYYDRFFRAIKSPWFFRCGEGESDQDGVLPSSSSGSLVRPASSTFRRTTGRASQPFYWTIRVFRICVLATLIVFSAGCVFFSLYSYRRVFDLVAQIGRFLYLFVVVLMLLYATLVALLATHVLVCSRSIERADVRRKINKYTIIVLVVAALTDCVTLLNGLSYLLTSVPDTEILISFFQTTMSSTAVAIIILALQLGCTDMHARGGAAKHATISRQATITSTNTGTPMSGLSLNNKHGGSPLAPQNTSISLQILSAPDGGSKFRFLSDDATASPSSFAMPASPKSRSAASSLL